MPLGGKNATISSYEPGFAERAYNAVEDTLTPALQALGYNPYEARKRARMPKDVMEFVVGPQAVEESARRVGKQGVTLDTAGDVANLAATLPIPFAKPLGLAVRKASKLKGPIGAVARGARAAKRYATEAPGAANFAVRQDGAFKVVDPLRVKARTVPAAAQTKSLTEVRELLRNPETNPMLDVANRQTLAVRGRNFDPQAPAPKTSLAKQSGIARTHQLAVEEDPAYKHAIFEAYGNQMPEVVEGAGAQNYDQLREAAYRKAAEEVKQNFDILGLTTRYHGGEGEYSSPFAMMKDVMANGRLNVFQGGDPHDFLNRIDPETGLNENEMFRAVHDAMGHGVTGTTFRPGGEEAAYAAHSQMMSPLAQMALLPETRGQNSIVNYSPLNADAIRQMNRLKVFRDDMPMLLGEARNYGPGHAIGDRARSRLEELGDPATVNARLRALGEQFSYAPQKAVLLPPEYLAPDTAGGVPDYIQELIKPRAPTDGVRGVHFGAEGLSELDPAMFGAGHRGQEYAWKGRAGSPDRSYFYTGPEGSITPESALFERGADRVPYEGVLNGMYDLEQDPEGLAKLAQAYELNVRYPVAELDRLVKEYGYNGFLGDNGRPAAAVYGKTPVRRLPVRPGNAGYFEGGLVE